jgi:hypothetical protein
MRNRMAEEMLALLNAARDRGEPRPSYRQMADRLGLRDRMAARNLFVRLQREGLWPKDDSP